MINVPNRCRSLNGVNSLLSIVVIKIIIKRTFKIKGIVWLICPDNNQLLGTPRQKPKTDMNLEVRIKAGINEEWLLTYSPRLAQFHSQLVVLYRDA